MSCALQHTTKLNSAAPAAGVVSSRAMTGTLRGLTTISFATGRNHPLAERRTG